MDREYFYKVNECKAIDSTSKDCICWHKEGDGPAKDRDEDLLAWREVPAINTISPKSNTTIK